MYLTIYHLVNLLNLGDASVEKVEATAKNATTLGYSISALEALLTLLLGALSAD
ncbi:MAG: hypothetical protein AAF974_07360 [Cyanobacteria bacterium P01_E01_bin.34]